MLFFVFKNLLKGFIVSLCLLSFISAYCLPAGFQLRQGAASSHVSGDNMTITAGDKSVIEYTDFSILENESVQFIQPSQQATVLNRVVGASSSQIMGSLSGNGQVYLINPSGIFIGENALVDVAGFYAAAGQMSNEDFLMGDRHFTQLQSSVVNEGWVQADAVYFLGQQVVNRGSIYAEGGLVAFICGKELRLGERDGHLFISFDHDGENMESYGGTGIQQAGSVIAEEGEVFLASGDFLYSVSIKNEGDILAGDVHMQALRGTIALEGEVAAQRGNKGGSVEIQAHTVELLEDFYMDASGEKGGGLVHLGGDLSSIRPLEPLSVLRMEDTAFIDLSAWQEGDAGELVIYAEESIDFSGEVYGAASGRGNGANVTIISEDALAFSGIIDVAAGVFGQAGLFVLRGGSSHDLSTNPAYVHALDQHFNVRESGPLQALKKGHGVDGEGKAQSPLKSPFFKGALAHPLWNKILKKKGLGPLKNSRRDLYLSEDVHLHSLGKELLFLQKGK